MGLHKSEENLEVAKAENAAILLEEDYQEHYDGFDPNLDEDYIMLNMFQSANIEQSLEFSQLLQDQMLTTAEMYDRGVRQAGFVILYLTTMPGVLLETGFLSNPGEERFLLDESNRAKIAGAIVNAIRIYKKETENKLETVLSANNPTKNEPTQKIKKTFRIGFTRMKKKKPLNDKMFDGMEEVWYYYKNDRYYYTFGKTATLNQAKDIYYKAVLNKKINWKYLKSAEIIEFQGDEVISKTKVIGQ
jgi:N-acetylmuramoyl-L-alanine amidase